MSGQASSAAGAAASGAAAGSLLGPVGALAGAGLGFVGGMMQNSASAEEAKKQREWQGMMSSTAHQREMWDLKLAGLNPILTATGGPGAASPGAAAANVPSNVGQAATTGALAGASAKQTIENAAIAKNQRKVSDIETKILTSGVGKYLALPISVFKKMGFGDKTAIAMGAAYSAGDIKKGITGSFGENVVDVLSNLWSSAKTAAQWKTYDFNEVNPKKRIPARIPEPPRPRRKNTSGKKKAPRTTHTHYVNTRTGTIHKYKE